MAFITSSFLLAFVLKKKKTLLAFTPNVKILESNMVSRNLDYGSKNIKKKKKHKHIVLKKKKWKAKVTTKEKFI